MKILSLELQDYRNYRELKLELSPGINVLYGDNAQGKTNALEAICLCATAKSHRGTKDRELIRFGEEEAHIKVMVEKRGVPCRVDVHLKKNRAKGVAVNGVPLRRVADLFGILHVVIFSPEDLGIIKDSPAERRRFLDMELCQLSRIYAHNLIRYHKVIAQRNKLLKEWDEQPELRDTLDIWDQQLVSYGVPLIENRRSFIRDLNQLVREIHFSISGGKEQAELSYVPNVEAEELGRVLARERSRDLKARTSLTGPHRDDMIFLVNGVDVRRFGSQGQQRTAALSLKLAEIEIVKKVIQDSPILLLDDVLSELDGSRQKQLLQRISHIQTVVTCTGLDEFVHHCFPIDRVFHIEDGKLTGGIHEQAAGI